MSDFRKSYTYIYMCVCVWGGVAFAWLSWWGVVGPAPNYQAGGPPLVGGRYCLLLFTRREPQTSDGLQSANGQLCLLDIGPRGCYHQRLAVRVLTQLGEPRV